MKSLDDAILSARKLFIKPPRRLKAFLVCSMAAFLLVLTFSAINGKIGRSTLQEDHFPTAEQYVMWRFMEYESAVEEPAEPPTQIAIPWDSLRVVCSDLGWTLVASGAPSDLDLAVNTAEGAEPLGDVLYVSSQ